MKNTIVLYLIIFCNINILFCQETTSMIFLIVDSSTGFPIKEAKIYVEEIGLEYKTSGDDGKINFQYMPIGKVNYNVTCDNYISKRGTFNISLDSKVNSKVIKLSKLPSPEEILISGEIIDKNGNDIDQARIEVRIGGNILLEITDASGNFNIYHKRDQSIKSGVAEILIEVDKDNCKSEDRLPIPKNDYVFRQISLKCDTLPQNPNENYKPKPIVKKGAGIEFKLNNCYRDGGKVICNFTIMAEFEKCYFTILGSIPGSVCGSNIYDESFHEYKSTNIILEGYEDDESIQLQLKPGIPVNINLIFDDISTFIKKIKKLILCTKINRTHRRVIFDDLPFKI